MTETPDEWRTERLQALVDSLPGKSEALGEKLGLKSGNYINQMLRGHRPISEKFIKKVQALPGYEAWFERSPGVVVVKHQTAMDAAVDLVAEALGKLSEAKRSAVLVALAAYVADPAAEAETRKFVVGALGGERPQQKMLKHAS